MAVQICEVGRDAKIVVRGHRIQIAHPRPELAKRDSARERRRRQLADKQQGRQDRHIPAKHAG